MFQLSAKSEFLLKFGKDRLRWLQCLYEAKIRSFYEAKKRSFYEAKKRNCLVTLNYVVTSNHVHLIVHGNNHGETIPKSIQRIAGRTGQECNRKIKSNLLYSNRMYFNFKKIACN